MTVVIPDDIVTMTMTPVTIRMCQLLNLPEIPFLFSQVGGQRRLRPCAVEAATLCSGGCHLMQWRLSPCAVEAVTLCSGGCGPMQ